jgi:ribonuclease BN (tRNA processing enzyme)
MNHGKAPGTRLSITVLGSGGPIANPARASSGCIVWLDNVPRLLVDAGGGTFVRLGELRVDVPLIDIVFLTHTHIDHSGGLAPVVMSAYMQGRTTRLRVVGPTGRDMHPGCERFVDLLFGRNGAWSYMHTFDGFGIDAREVPSTPVGDTRTLVLEDDALTIQSVAVPHGMMPSVAYRIDYAGASVAFTGDIQRLDRGFIDLASGCDMLVHDQAVPERQVAHSHLHTKPSETARIAREVGCRTLVLTHFMPEIEAELDAAVQTVVENFPGRVVVAHDRMTIDVGPGVGDL